MSKQQLGLSISQKTGCSLKAGNEIVDIVSENILEAIKSEGKFYLPGIGTFSLCVMESGEAINPATQEKVKTKKRGKIKFKCSSTARNSLTEWLHDQDKKKKPSKKTAEKTAPKLPESQPVKKVTRARKKVA